MELLIQTSSQLARKSMKGGIITTIPKAKNSDSDITDSLD
jgi:hypothetical protein